MRINISQGILPKMLSFANFTTYKNQTRREDSVL